MRAHIIKDEVVENTIEVESLDVLPGLIDGDSGGAIGDLWDGEKFTPPPPPVRTKAKVQAEIDQIERETIMNRLARELALRTMEKEAGEWSADPANRYYGVPVATILSGVIGYTKCKAIDAQVTALRAEWATAP